MLHVQLLAFSKLKTPGLRDAADYYAKMLSSWAKFQETELKPIPVPDKSPATRARIQAQEEELLLSRIPKGARLILLDETGKALPTLQWAERVRDWEGSGSGGVCLCIGSSLGFSEALRKRASAIVSLGPQTLSHELARVCLLEQLYRAWSVVRGHPYHVEG